MARKRKSVAPVKKKISTPSPAFEEQRLFKNPKLINDHFICPICQDVFNNPFRLTCGHSFCKSCIDEWLKHNNTCPIDRNAVVMKYCHKDILLENIIGELMIACPWRQFGCMELDKHSIIKDHKEKCIFNINKMDPDMQATLLASVEEEQQRRKLAVSKSLKTSIEGPSVPKRSVLDELIASLPDDDESEDDLNSTLNNVKPPEMLPLSLRLYLNENEENRAIIKNIIQK